MEEIIKHAICGECHAEELHRSYREQEMKFMENDRNEHTRNIFRQKPYYMQKHEKR